MVYPWEVPAVSDHIRERRAVCALEGRPGIRQDLTRRRPPDGIEPGEFGIAIMSHRGASNGRLSVLLSSIPSNYPVLVVSDSIDHSERDLEREVCTHHGASYHHEGPWGGRARNALMTAEFGFSRFDPLLFLNDDVYLYEETCRSSLDWWKVLQSFEEIPLAALAIPGWHTRDEHPQWGYTSWQECLDKPWMFEGEREVNSPGGGSVMIPRVPPNPAFSGCPQLWKNPFGACMVLGREAYRDLGGFSIWEGNWREGEGRTLFWAEDDVYNHQVWTSRRWVSIGIPGRGYMHYGGQSWHHGESEDFVGEFKNAVGMTGEESGQLQVESMRKWQDRLGPTLRALGGQ